MIYIFTLLSKIDFSYLGRGKDVLGLLPVAGKHREYAVSLPVGIHMTDGIEKNKFFFFGRWVR